MMRAPRRRSATRISRCGSSARCAISSSAPPPTSASSCSSRSPITWCAPTSSAPPSPRACRRSAHRSPPARDARRVRKPMPRSLLKPALFFDFDNTLTHGDVLDELIERYSPNESWRDWEEAWQHGRLAARECLRLQVENMRVSRGRLLEDVARVRIDPVFADVVGWAKRHDVAVRIVSDSFLPLIAHILSANGIEGIPVFANDLRFAPGRRL